VGVTAKINKTRFYRGERIVITGEVSPASTDRNVRLTMDYFCNSQGSWFYGPTLYTRCYSDGRVCRYTFEFTATVQNESYCRVGRGDVQRWRGWVAAVPDGANAPVYAYVEWEVVNLGAPPEFEVVGYDYSRTAQPGGTGWLVLRVRNTGGDGDIKVEVMEGSLTGRTIAERTQRVPGGSTAEVRVEFPVPGSPGRHTFAAYAINLSTGATVWYLERFEVEVTPGVSITSVSLSAEPVPGEARARATITIGLSGPAPVDLSGEYLVYADGTPVHHGFFEVPKGSSSATVSAVVDLPGYGSYALYAEAWLGTEGPRVRSNTVQLTASAKIRVSSLSLSADRDEVQVAHPVNLTVTVVLGSPAPRRITVPVSLYEEGGPKVTDLGVDIDQGSSTGKATVGVVFSEPGTYTLYAEAPDEVG